MTDRASIGLRRVRAIRIHCPISRETFVALAAGRLEAIEQDPVAAPILALIRADNELGDFGLYKGVFEISLGLEGFTPTAEADPTLGEGGGNTLSPTAVIKTYVDEAVGEDQLSALLSALAGLHPWQIPVIEVSGRGAVSLIQPI
ncbi:hypothetical protein [Phenylobacterium montanum]|uniref:Uncharacterized protein n=1 Tax=Phenylobacterium montanum TaxID=2823693 RepID=A0A975FYY8_9CAUL|nr:hypothetical protein [Caulobacter sp. S6]QUD88048.1 hypothetical protein KCG34_23955 [Caulobacter sp. S6]